MHEKPKRKLHFSAKEFSAYALTAFVAGGVAGAAIQSAVGGEEKTKTVMLEAPKQNLNIIFQSVLNLSPLSQERKSAENLSLSMVQANPTLENINKALMVTTDPFVRAQLLDERYSLRKNGGNVLQPIPEDKLEWIKQTHGIHPEILGITLDAYPKAKKIIETLIKSKKLREDGLQITADEAMINPGGMARLIVTETGEFYRILTYGFSNIGGGLVNKELNDTAFPQSRQALVDLAKIASSQTGLKFTPENIVGSLRGDPDFNLSGGAISIQFMPDRALKIHNLVKAETGISLNVFNPDDATVMAYIFLAIHEKVGDSYRFGYRKGYPGDILAALAKWNPFPAQYNTIYSSAINYFDKFLKDKKYEY